MRLQFQKGDYIAIAATLLFALAVFLAFLPGDRNPGGRAELYLDGALYRTVSLNVPQEFAVVAEFRNTVTVKDGKIAVTASDCPGGDCMHSGWVDSSGRSIVCLPNRLEIRIVSESGDVDFVVG